MISQSLVEALAGKRILVTGVSGFIGARLARRLLDFKPLQVRALVRSTSSRSQVADLDLDFVEADLADGQGLPAALEEIDLVFHLAGLTRARSLQEFRRVNVEGCATLARAAREAGVERFVHTSSLAAIGPCPEGVEALDESSPAAPVTWYGQSKLESEQVLPEAAGDMDHVIVRPPGVYGPGERDFFTMFQMVWRRCAPVLGLRPKSYSFVFSEDLIDAMLQVAVAPAASGQTYFVAEPRVWTDADMLRFIEKALGRRAYKPRLPHALVQGVAAVNDLLLPLMKRPPLLSGQKMNELRPGRWVVDSGKLEREVGYVCPTSLEEGVQRTADWYRRESWL